MSKMSKKLTIQSAIHRKMIIFAYEKEYATFDHTYFI